MHYDLTKVVQSVKEHSIVFLKEKVPWQIFYNTTLWLKFTDNTHAISLRCNNYNDPLTLMHLTLWHTKNTFTNRNNVK